MLTIKHSFRGSEVFAVSGRVDFADIAELQRVLVLENNEKISLDLQDVTLVSRDVVKFLEECEVSGIDLINCPAYVREWIEAERTSKRR